MNLVHAIHADLDPADASAGSAHLASHFAPGRAAASAAARAQRVPRTRRSARRQGPAVKDGEAAAQRAERSEDP
jgi:hypothetical protein